MFNEVCLSKSKRRTIVLLHGLFTGPGFWLPYLKYFRNYNVVLMDIDYSFLSEFDKFVPTFRKKIQEIAEAKDLVAIISHSLGTYVSLGIGEHLPKCNIHICPIYISKRLHADQFSELIAARVKVKNSEIILMLDKVDAFDLKNREKFRRASLYSTQLFIPEHDAFFKYETISPNVSVFEGDHFNIENALKQLTLNGDI